MEHIVTNNSSLSIVTCPVCHRAITVYMDTGPETEMVCPLCNSKYEFQTLLDGLPPMLQLASEADLVPIAKPDEDTKKFSFDEVPAPPSPRKSTNKKRRHSSKSKDDSRSRSSAPNRNERSEKKRKAAFKKSSPLRETILFVLGGLLALPVGQLIIWWVIGKDPLNFGPPVSQVAGFAVPEKFRAKVDPEDGDGDAGNGKSDRQGENGDQDKDNRPLPEPKKFQPEDVIKNMDKVGGKNSGGKIKK